MLQAVRTLLAGSIDYAGLFPPAELGMPQALASYAQHQRGEHAWMLARFVVPASRLAELAQALPEIAAAPWRLSALAGPALAADIALAEAFNERFAPAGAAQVDALELKAASAPEIEAIARAVPAGMPAYVELPIEADPAPLIARLAGLGLRAKVRTGGVTAGQFPLATDLARFLAACVAAGVRFKATAGLHHPIRAEYRLTYAPGSPTAPMYGFLNLLLATAFLHAGLPAAEAAGLLEETDPAAFAFGDAGFAWRGRRLTAGQLAQARAETMQAFGSCSFGEPAAELIALGLL